jgi:hypothetical protein
LCIAAKATKANAAIIGRHSVADLYLDSDPSMSLRHLAIIVDPMSAWARDGGDLRFRIADLRTPLAFEDENGRRLDAVIAEGPIFLRCGQFALMCLVTGDESDWPPDAKEAWECIPERVYLEESPAEPDRWRRQRRNPLPGDSDDDGPAGQRITRVQRARGPARVQKHLLEEDEQPLGTLHIRTRDASQSITIGPRAAERGILLGRYDRCDASEATVLTDQNISRVHLLLVQVAGSLYAIDVASTNGTWKAEAPARGPHLATGTQHDIDDGFLWRELRITEMTQTTYLALGEGLAYLSWSPNE